MSTKFTPYFMEDVRRASAQSLFSFATGFSGCGGADIGYSHAGGRSIFAIEFDPNAARTFRRNFPDTEVIQEDFRAVMASPTVMSRLVEVSRDLDLLHLSPPCNGFSKLGPGPESSGTADLLLESMRMAAALMPRVVVLENVPDLAGVHAAYLGQALTELRFDESGNQRYFLRHRIVSAADCGVAQARRRVIVIGVRADVARAVGINDDGDVGTCFPELQTPKISVGEALAGLQQDEWDLLPFERAAMTSNLGRFVRMLPRDPPKPRTLRQVGMGTRRFSLIRASNEKPCPTLTASGQRPDGRSGVVHPVEDRKMTIKEMMRLSGFPDDFDVEGEVREAATRIGMCVPPPMAKAIATSIYNRVFAPYPNAKGARRSQNF